ncbi:peptidoglycan-binding domain-containing protein [Caulobacter sp. NIBR1757]|uniref:peptidoglycan-binding domain-containing protein n=1 Tax=Caulobacter sp. NIBR1757 TaxID=3016000 RepID=UPI0022F143A5|nr:peptidoglycan-binding domain-containing protein [Caulobacter sp. NIBR1757]WGM40718.1 hypothetical protein AMEJIAPC_03665 [Caulobacter sp. NIBR1757]
MGRSKLLGGVALGATLLALSAGGAMAGGPGGDFPPNAVPGKCYEKVLIPPSYESYTEQIVDSPARVETRVIPAVYGEEVQQVLVREERVEYITLPATYRTVTETIILKAASVRTETVAAVYETITERVMVREAHYEWRRGVPKDQRPSDPNHYKVLSTGEVLCLVEVPAEYSTVTRKVLRTPERTVEIQVPAETQVVTRQVIDQDARVEKRVIPAEYRSVRVRVVVTKERVETYTIPAIYKTVTKQRMVSDTSFQWREIVCADKASYSAPPSGYAPPPPPSSYPKPPKSYPKPPPAPPSGGGYGRDCIDNCSAPQAGGLYGADAAPRPYAEAGGAQQVRLTPQLVRDMQSALGLRGYYTGPRDGQLSAPTRAALSRFQSDRKLAGGVTTETLLALGVGLP